MKMKAIAMLLVCLLLCGCVLPIGLNARAEEAWICTDCRIWVSGYSCPQCGRARPDISAEIGECVLHLKIDFKENQFFSTYDAEVIINGEHAFTIPHGKLLDSAVLVPTGRCTILLRNAEDHTEDVRFVLDIIEETLFTCDISAHFYGLEVANVVCNANEGDSRLAVGETGVRDGVEMTILQVKESRGSTACRPADGYVFVWCEFEIRNPSDKTIFLFPTLGFRAVCDGYTVNPSQRAASTAPMSFPTNLISGEKARGMLCYELPVNWRSLRLTYSGLFEELDQLSFSIQHN